MWKILATSERYEIPNVASRSSVGINPKQLQMSMPIEPERRQFLWYFLYLCWDRPNFLKIGIFGWGKQLLLGRLIGSELLHQLPCRTLDNLNFAIVGDTHMAEDFLPDLFAGAHRFDDLDPGPIEFGIRFGAYEHAANHNRCAAGCQELFYQWGTTLLIIQTDP